MVLVFSQIPVYDLFIAEKTIAGDDDNISGWAWSENIGWVSFNCNNPELSAPRCNKDYGVNINDATGKFSGYAWSRGTDADEGGVGWIDFAPTGPYPGAPNYSVCVNLPNISNEVCEADLLKGQIGGWARVVSSGEWIKLRGTNYGVYVDKTTGEFHGWAYGGESMGWLSFNCVEGGDCGDSDYKVKTALSFNSAPDKPGIDLAYPEGESLSHCSFQGKSIPSFYWTYSDPETNPQIGYEIWIDDDPGFLDPKFNNLVEASASTAYTLDLSQDDECPGDCWLSNLAWNTTYYWKVKVTDDIDDPSHWSEWSDVNSFATPKHAWPWPDFAPSPVHPGVNGIVHFIQNGAFPHEDYKSLCYAGGEHLCEDDSNVVYEWDIGNGQIPDICDIDINCRGNATTTYTAMGTYTIKLTITDTTLPGTCSRSKPINISLPFPIWEEIRPQ